MSRFITFALLIGTLLASCKKTEVVPYEKEPANRIVTYKVINAAEALQGVVDDVDNTITVYLPYYLSIDYIVPELVLQEGATLIDKNGNKIDIREDLDPVPFDSVGYTYRVRDDKNNIRQYTLVTKIVPHKDPLKLGYEISTDDNGNFVVDDKVEKEALVNSRIEIYGNLESSSKNAKLTLVNKKTNAVVSNALKVYEVVRAPYFHYLSADIAAGVDSGYYYIIAEHQGRKDTLPTIHLIYQKPQFQWLAKTYAVGDTVTLNVVFTSGINTGIHRVYAKIIKYHYDFPGAYVPANFPLELFDVPIELEMISQSRTQIRFKFPDIPVGLYSTYISGSAGGVNDTGFGFYFDFDSEAWGKDNLLSSVPYTFEVTGHQ